jgi:DNA/RNA endonuclease YhcR with UshA esterase domain
MKKITTGWLAFLLAVVAAGSPRAHHSLANFDTTQAVRVKGTIVQIHRINPHSFIFLDQQDSDGQTHRWAAEGPAIRQLDRTGARDVLKPGDVVEVCGYVPKERVMWQIASADTTAISPAGRLINAEVLVMPDGRQQSWGDYGVHKCFAPGYADQHPSR